MKQTINLHNFRDAFHNMGRGEQFSYEGLEILFDFIEDCERDLGEEWELDVIALCCDFSEQTESEVRDTYSIEEGQDVEQFLLENTMLCGCFEDNGIKTFIYQNY